MVHKHNYYTIAVKLITEEKYIFERTFRVIAVDVKTAMIHLKKMLDEEPEQFQYNFTEILAMYPIRENCVYRYSDR